MKSLQVRIGLIFIGIVLVISLIVALITSLFFQKQINEKIGDETKEIALAAEQQLQIVSIEEVQKNFTDFTSYELSVLNAEQVQQTGIFDRAELTDLLTGHVISAYDNKKMVFAYPIEIKGIEQFALVSLKSAKLVSFLDTGLFVVLLLTLIIGACFIFIASYTIVRPIRSLTKQTQKITEGNFDVEFLKGRKDEVGQLNDSFSKMVVSLHNMLKVREDFISNITHEFQTPLTSINGFSKALQHKQLPKEKQLQYVQIIEQESNRLSHLSKNILKLSQLQNSTYTLEKEHFHLDEQIRQVIIALEPQWSLKQIQFELDLPKSVYHGDRFLLQQVWINTINNAITYSPTESIITIFISKQIDTYKITIQDEGPGIREEDIPFIFEPFYKGVEGKENVAGNGLGLSIVQQILEKHQGAIALLNEHGLRLEIELPIQVKFENAKTAF